MKMCCFLYACRILERISCFYIWNILEIAMELGKEERMAFLRARTFSEYERASEKVTKMSHFVLCDRRKEGPIMQHPHYLFLASPTKQQVPALILSVKIGKNDVL